MVKAVVGEAEADQRLDRALAALLGVPRARVQRWIEAGLVRCNDRPAKASQGVAAGDRLEAEPPEPVEASVAPEAIPLVVLHEDSHLIVIDKPAGMVVHPAPGHPRGTLVNALLHHCGDLAGIGGVLRPGIVHRLDRGTSGVIVAAKDDETHLGLSTQFRDHSVERVYLAIVRAVPRADEGRVDQPIGRHRRDRKRMSVMTTHGREAHTAWRVQKRFDKVGLSLVEVRPETGRTHQIRVHLSSRGLPLLCDDVYGKGRARSMGLERPALHAAVLGFDHPSTGVRLRFESPLPEDMASLIARLESAA